MTTNNSWNGEDPISVAKGGTLKSTFTANTVLIGNAAGVINEAGPGVSTDILTSNGPGFDPTYQAAGSGITVVAPTSWTPTLEGSTTPGTIVYTTQDAFFTRIGSLVYLSVTVRGNYTAGTEPVGEIIMKTLPLTPSLVNGFMRSPASIFLSGFGEPAAAPTTLVFDADTTVRFISGFFTESGIFDRAEWTGGTRSVFLQTSFWYTI